jgi:Fic family protein
MTRKKGVANKPDVLAKFFIKHYKIATQKDLAKLNTRLDRIENQLKLNSSGKNFPVKYKVPHSNSKITSTDIVYDLIKHSKKGLKFAEIQAQTGFKDRTIRNILYRLHQNGIIQRKSRGVYIAG